MRFYSYDKTAAVNKTASPADNSTYDIGPMYITFLEKSFNKEG